MEWVNATDVISIAEKLGAPGFATFLLIVLWAGYKQIWTWGHQLRTMKDDRDFWRAAALRQTHLAERAMTSGVEGPRP